MKYFVEVRRRGLKVNADKNKMMVLNGKEELEYEVCLYGMQLEYMSEFKYLGYVLDESGMQMRQSIKGRWQIGGLQILQGL